jgi:serine/threonine protein kinase
MHKIFKLCGSPSEAYWTKKKFPHATSFKPQQPYIRRIAETFKNFTPSALTLVDKLLSMEPQDRGSATSALRSEVIISYVLFNFRHSKLIVSIYHHIPSSRHKKIESSIVDLQTIFL